MRPELEAGISQSPTASFRAFVLHQPAFTSHWHYHPELELVLFTRGTGIRFIGNDISLYNEGDLFLIGAGIPHTFVSYKSADGSLVEAHCIQFRAELFDAFAESAPLRTLFAEAGRGLHLRQPPETLLSSLRAVTDRNGLPALVALLETLTQLTTLADREPILAPTYRRPATLADPTTRIRTAIDWVNTAYQRPVSLADMAARCHLSPNAFCRWFRQQTGQTLIDYVNTVRLTHVCQLLLLTDEPIGVIATRTGFDNPGTLNRLFRARLQSTPSQYRQAHRPG
ncbi:AraC family transcriptional regulator [Spirosoma luteolum]